MKIIKKNFFILFVLIIPLFTYFSYCFGGDLLKNIFESSIENRAVINIGDDKETVGRSLLRKSSGFSRAQGIYQDAPIIVNIVKFILKITVVLSVTMVIYYGVKFMLQVFKGDDLKSATAKKDLINLFIGLLIALFSITAVTLVISIPKSTLNDISFNNILGENICL